MIVDNQKNLKVHFAGMEVINQATAVVEMKMKYGLYTAFAFVERMVFEKTKSPLMPFFLNKEPYKEIPNWINDNMNHTIQDSGLFTLMFGSHKGKVDKKIFFDWYDALIDFTKHHNNNCTVIEVDCQKVLGVKDAWMFRERMKKDLKNRQLNVFHIEDGRKGLDRLIEFSDYIAISVPELRFAGKKFGVIPLANYIKNKKPEIDIHLLGCTELKLLNELRFCTSSDSTTYTAGKRYGFLKSRHIKNIKNKEVRKLISDQGYAKIRKYNNEQNTDFLILSIYLHNQEYIKNAGCQN